MFQVIDLSNDQKKRQLLKKIVELEGEVTEAKSDNSKLSSQMENYSKVTDGFLDVGL